MRGGGLSRRITASGVCSSVGFARTGLLRCGWHSHSGRISLYAEPPSLPSRGRALFCLIPFLAFSCSCTHGATNSKTIMFNCGHSRLCA